MKKFVFFDTNSPTGSGEIYPISELIVASGKLAEGDLVNAYMLGEREFWDARIVRRGGQWGIKLLSEGKEMTAERYAGQHEGFSEGMLCQKLRALQVLESLELPEEIKENVYRRMLEI